MRGGREPRCRLPNAAAIEPSNPIVFDRSFSEVDDPPRFLAAVQIERSATFREACSAEWTQSDLDNLPAWLMGWLGTFEKVCWTGVVCFGRWCLAAVVNTTEKCVPSPWSARKRPNSNARSTGNESHKLPFTEHRYCIAYTAGLPRFLGQKFCEYTLLDTHWKLFFDSFRTRTRNGSQTWWDSAGRCGMPVDLYRYVLYNM